MAIYVCCECGSNFHTTSGAARWCPSCAVVERECVHCGESFTIRRRRLNETPGRARYCSMSCSSRASAPSRLRGAAHFRFNGGLCFDKGKNRWVIVCRDGTLMHYYRGVMAAHIGRLLTSDEIIHHVNGDPTDDRIENLEITTRAEHMEMHRADLQGRAA